MKITKQQFLQIQFHPISVIMRRSEFTLFLFMHEKNHICVVLFPYFPNDCITSILAPILKGLRYFLLNRITTNFIDINKNSSKECNYYNNMNVISWFIAYTDR